MPAVYDLRGERTGPQIALLSDHLVITLAAKEVIRPGLCEATTELIEAIPAVDVVVASPFVAITVSIEEVGARTAANLIFAGTPTNSWNGMPHRAA